MDKFMQPELMMLNIFEREGWYENRVKELEALLEEKETERREQCIHCVDDEDGDFAKAVAEIEKLEKERDHWKSNHEDMKRRNAFLLQRPDLDVTRIPVYEEMKREIEKLKLQLSGRTYFHDNEAVEKLLLDTQLELERVKQELDVLQNPVYCPTCGSCGEEGCCSPDICYTVTERFYCEENVRSWQEMNDALVEAEQELAKKNDYYQAIEDALVCWEMTPTGDAKQDLHGLLCMEINTALDPAVSSAARELISKETQRCIDVLLADCIIDTRCLDSESSCFACKASKMLKETK